MRRNMQNLSFLAIISVLLSCAFFFSQQTNKKTTSAPVQVMETEVAVPETIADIPDCTGLDSDKERLTCFSEAAVLSDLLVESKVDAILSEKPESEDRLAFMETQLAWEDSREADCAFVFAMTSNEAEAELNEAICLYEHNLDRYEQLQDYYCEWFDPSACEVDH